MADLRVGFIGLGAMGLPMAGHLKRAACSSPSATAARRRRKRSRTSTA